MRSTVLLLLLGLSLAFAPIALALPIEPLDGVATRGPVETVGITETNAVRGAVRVAPQNELAGIWLHAEGLRIDMSWQRGVEVHLGNPLFRHVTERGNESIPLRGAEVTFDRYQGGALFLPHADAGAMEMHLTSATGLTLRADRDVALSEVGSSPGGVGAGGDADLGFWYTLEGPVARATGGGVLRVEGSFSLFVHDVHIDARGADGDWSSWTGYQASHPGAPVTEFEFRVTTIHVENGTFMASSASGIDLLAPRLEAHIDGAVVAGDVSGRLQRGEEVFVFDGDPFRLRGSGTVAIDAVDEGTALRLSPAGMFDVQGAGRIETMPGPAGPLDPLKTAVLATGSLFTAAAMVGMVAMGVIPLPSRRSRALRRERWMRKGKAAASRDEWPSAASCYARAARVDPDEPVAWYEWAHSELQAGRPDAADAVAVRAQDVPGIDPLDLLELRAAAALRRGDAEGMNAHLTALAQGSPSMAQEFVEALGVDSALFDARTRIAIVAGRGEGHLDGYV